MSVECRASRGVTTTRSTHLLNTHFSSFFAVDPSPGSLILFPGYVPHCVFPTSSDARVSVAANITRLGGGSNGGDTGGGGSHGTTTTTTTKTKITTFSVSGWCNVNTKGDYNMLHTHGDALFAAVLYV